MKRLLVLFLSAIVSVLCQAQTLDIRPQFGHDPLCGHVTEDGKYAVTAGRHSIILWDLQEGNVIIEQPVKCVGVQFVKGFPYFYVAVDFLYANGYKDSSRNVNSIFNILTGEKVFEMVTDAISADYKSPFQISFPFDPQGRFEITDNVGDIHSKWGGKIKGGMSNPELSPDGRYLLVAGKHPVLWDLDEMKVFREIPLYEHFMQNPEIVDAGLNILPMKKERIKKQNKSTVLIGWRQFFKAHFDDKGRIISGTPDGRVCVYSREGELMKEYYTTSKTQNIYDCAVYGNTVIAGSANQLVYIGSTDSDTLSSCLANNPEGIRLYSIIYEVLPIPDKDMFVGTSDSGIYFGSLSHPEKGLDRVSLYGKEGFSVTRYDEKHILVTGTNSYRIVNIDSREVNGYSAGIKGDIHALAVLDDGTVLVGTERGSVSVIKQIGKQPVKTFSLGYGDIRGFAEDPLRGHIYVTSSDGALRVLDSKSYDLIVTCYNLGDNNSIIFTPDGYYAADKCVANLIMYGRGAELYSFDRFDLVKNRPDIIRQRLGGTKEEVVLLEAVYRKRLRRMGFQEEQLQETAMLPEVDITRFPSAKEVNVDRITMSVQLRDRTFSLAKMMVWINGTPLFGRDGMSLDGKEVERDVEVRLASGENRIEVSCINSAGIESLREGRTIIYSNPHPRRDLYVITVGVSEYQRPGFNLNYAAKDASDMVSLFAECGKGLYDNIHTLCLTNGDVGVTTPSVIREFISGAGRDDSIIAFYAGHGLVSRDYDYYLSTYGTDFSSPETSAISYDDFEAIFDGVLPLNKLLLIDACHSGEIDIEDVQYVEAASTTKGKVLFRGTSLGQESVESRILKAQFNDIRRTLGTTVLAGSSGLEVAVEGEQWKNGLFTWTIRKGLQDMAADADKDNRITVSEMMRYGEREVYRLSDGRQSPGARQINSACDFVIKVQGR